MASDVNYFVATGRLTKDIEVKAVGESHLISGTFACNRSEKKGDEWKEVASFFDFKYWVKSQKQVDYLQNNFTKGSAIVIDGRLNQETWEKDGKKNSKIVINVNNLKPMGKVEAKQGSAPTSSASAEEFPEDIPF